MIIRLQIRFKPDFGARSRKANRILKAAHEAGARFWHRVCLPRHFTRGATGRYGFRLRSEQYHSSKKKRGKPALVYSGVTRETALRTIGVKAYPTRATLTLYTPSWIPQRPRRPNMPDMADELFRVRDDEQKQIEAVEQATAEKMLREMKETRTVRIG